MPTSTSRSRSPARDHSPRGPSSTAAGRPARETHREPDHHATTLTRLIVLAMSIVFIAGLGFLTVSSMVTHGLSLEGVVSVLVLLVLGVGIIGAMSTPPQ